jgi:hypothetical protein
MFRRGKGKGKDEGERRANRLAREAKPNSLSWTSEEAAEAGEDFALDEEELDGEAFDEEEPLEAEFSEDEEDEEDDETEAEIARRQLELQAELDREAEEFGLTAVDTAAAYGANGELVLQVLDDLEAIDVDDAERLADSWLAVDPAERDVVERELRHRHRDGVHGYELTAAEDAIATWLSGKLSSDPDDTELWRIVADAARGAVDALILDEDLDDADYSTLYGAWSEVMEPDEDDEAEASGEGKGKGKAGAKGTPAAAGSQTDYGPNGELVNRLIEKVRDLTTEDAMRLTESWRGQSKADLRQAHAALKDVVEEDATWRAQVKAAQDAVADLLTAKLVHRATMRTDVMEKYRAARQAAMPAAVDAVSALVLADLLEPEDAETLFGPWADTIGDPALPEFEGEQD